MSSYPIIYNSDSKPADTKVRPVSGSIYRALGETLEAGKPYQAKGLTLRVTLSGSESFFTSTYIKSEAISETDSVMSWWEGVAPWLSDFQEEITYPQSGGVIVLDGSISRVNKFLKKRETLQFLDSMLSEAGTSHEVDGLFEEFKKDIDDHRPHRKFFS